MVARGSAREASWDAGIEKETDRQIQLRAWRKTNWRVLTRRLCASKSAKA